MTPNKPISRYTLEINPDEHIIGLVRNLKQRLGKKLERNYGSVNSLAHITLIAFYAYDEDYPIILAEFKRVLAGLQPFEIEFSGFGDFSNNPDCVFYAKPDEDSATRIIAQCRKVSSNFTKFIKKKYTREWLTSATKNPHISIARELLKEEIFSCFELFGKNFPESFHCNSFVVRKFNDERKQYDIIDTIPLLGHEYMAGQ